MQSNKLRMAIRATAAAAVMGIASQPALAQSSSELQAQIDNLQTQLDEMKPGNGQSGWMIPGTNTSIKIGGYAKLDLIYDFDQAQGSDLFPAGLDLNANEDGSFRAQGTESRFNIATSTPTDVGAVKTFIEADFSTTEGNEVFSNSRGLRIRHAYGQWGNWLAGQTWSNFMHFTAFPATVDFGGSAGTSFIRQAQLRYTAPLGNGGALSFSVENAEATGFAGANDVMPDFTAKYKWAGSGGGVEFAALARQLESNSDAADDTSFAYGLMAAGRIKVTDSTTLMAGVIFGDGVGRYIFSAADLTGGTRTGRFAGPGAAYIDANGDLETVEALATTASIAQQWTPKLSSGLSYGRVEGDQPSDLFPESFETIQTVHFSNFYQVAKPVQLGLELSWTDKELMNGESVDAMRLQAAAKVSF